MRSRANEEGVLQLTLVPVVDDIDSRTDIFGAHAGIMLKRCDCSRAQVVVGDAFDLSLGNQSSFWVGAHDVHRDRLAIQGQRPSILQNEPNQTRRSRYVPSLSVGLAFILFEIEWGSAEIRTTLCGKVCSEQKGEAKYEFPHWR